MGGMRLRLVMLLAVLSITMTACGDDGSGGSSSAKTATTPAGTQTAALPVIDLGYGGGTLRVEVASTASERARGLGGRQSLVDDAGMLFDLGVTRVPSFWMKDTVIPLDMVWINEDKSVQGVTADIATEPGVSDRALKRYSPSEPVRYVLELNAGTAERIGLTAGEQLTFEAP
jgi:uncharacterized membrane protein (UPF0127 family)